MTPENSAWTAPSRRMAFCLFLAAIFAQPAFVAAFWHITWDDAAITLAFARTFALTGRVELTPGSGIVEGYSTPLWMFLLAAISRVAASPATLLVIAKILTCLLGMANIVLTRRILRGWGQVTLADLTAGAFGLMELTLYESINAMETPLILCLMLSAVSLLPLRTRSQTVVFTLLTCIIVVARFETILLVVPLLFLLSRRRRWLVASCCFTTGLAADLARWFYFHAWLPNTILAKRHLPYSAGSAVLELRRHLLPAITLGRAFAMLLIVLALAALLGRRQLQTLARQTRGTAFWRNHYDLRVAALIAGSGLLLDFAVGQNWGPPDRELFATLPFLVFLVLRLTFALVRDARRRSLILMLLLALISYRTVRSAQRMADPAAPLYMPMITVDTIAALLPPVERIRQAAALPDLTFATPDVGGVSLFAQHIRILDAGLLCDPYLARTGYTDAARYLLEQRRPEVMELHNFWAELTGVGDIPAFYRQYVPLLVAGKRYFIRRDVFDRFAAQTTPHTFTAEGHPQPADQPTPLLGTVYPDYSAIDLRINGTFATYFTFTR